MNRWNGFLRILTLRCAAASELSSRELDEPLRTPEQIALWGHLLACRSCRRFRRQIHWIRAALRLSGRLPTGTEEVDAALSEEARRRIARAIGQAAQDNADGRDLR
jgi:hypothetical protein